MRAWILIAFSAVLGCGGKAPETPEGSCSLVGDGEWSCKTTSTNATQALPECPADTQSGGSCGETNVDTTNPTMPAHYVEADNCFSCASAGLGTDWTCGSQGWEVASVFSCPP